MLTSTDWISYLKSCTSIKSDYGVAKLLQVNRSTMSSLVNRKSFLGIKSTKRIADQLQIDPEYIYICAQFERSKSEDERKLWLDLYDRIGGPQLDEIIRKKLDLAVMSHD